MVKGGVVVVTTWAILSHSFIPQLLGLSSTTYWQWLHHMVADRLGRPSEWMPPSRMDHWPQLTHYANMQPVPPLNIYSVLLKALWKTSAAATKPLMLMLLIHFWGDCATLQKKKIHAFPSFSFHLHRLQNKSHMLSPLPFSVSLSTPSPCQHIFLPANVNIVCLCCRSATITILKYCHSGCSL